MVNRRISDDAYAIAMRLVDRGLDSDSEIADLCGFSTRSLARAKRRRRLTGTSAKGPILGLRGRPRILAHGDVAYLVSLARHRPTLFLDEYRRRFMDQWVLHTHLSTVHRALERCGINTKRVQKLAYERSPLKRAEFVHRISRYPPSCIVSVDETSKDDRTYMRLFARSPRGTRAQAQGRFVRKRRFSLLVGLALDEGIIASKVVEGSFNHQSFYRYLRDDLVSLSLETLKHHLTM
jgi:transposase